MVDERAIRERLRQARKRAGFTQATFAERLEMDTKAYQRRESGFTAITIADLCRITATLGVDWAELETGAAGESTDAGTEDNVTDNATGNAVETELDYLWNRVVSQWASETGFEARAVVEQIIEGIMYAQVTARGGAWSGLGIAFEPLGAAERGTGAANELRWRGGAPVKGSGDRGSQSGKSGRRVIPFPELREAIQ